MRPSNSVHRPFLHLLVPIIIHRNFTRRRQIEFNTRMPGFSVMVTKRRQHRESSVQQSFVPNVFQKFKMRPSYLVHRRILQRLVPIINNGNFTRRRQIEFNIPAPSCSVMLTLCERAGKIEIVEFNSRLCLDISRSLKCDHAAKSGQSAAGTDRRPAAAPMSAFLWTLDRNGLSLL